MILKSNHVLVNEICKQNDIAMSNFSPLASDDALIESESVIKMGATTVINKDSVLLPKYIRELANKDGYTNLDGLIMFSELKDEYYLTKQQIERIGKIIDICDKKFVRLHEDLLKVFSESRWVIYPVDKSEIEEPCMNDIVVKKQFKQIDNKTFLTWY